MTLAGFSAEYLGDELGYPSLDYYGDKLLFYEVYAGTPYLSLLDRASGTLLDVLAGAQLDHPYLTADGEHVTFSFGGDVAVASLVTGEIDFLSPNARTTDSASAWSRGDFARYTASTSGRRTFVRPDDGSGLTAAQRTVAYHVYELRPLSNAYYSISSLQDYDGYLNLYVGSFDPRRPERNLVASNDDDKGAFADGVGTSRIVAELSKRKTYYVVTSACGAPGSPCGPSSGNFQNTIQGDVTPPPPPQPPTELPAPDNTKFNITLRFWNDSLTLAEQQVFTIAADRWSEVITGDLQDIPGFALTEAQTTPGAPGMVGTLDDVVIDAAKVAIDGPSGVLARAGAYYTRNGGPDDFLPVYGIMEFDEAEFGPGGFFEDQAAFAETILHEMGHVLGISRAFWIPLGLISGNPADTSVCSDVAKGDDPRYEGAGGNDAWVNFYGADSPRVPIANENGCGTADSHWREIYLQDELMTGFASSTGEPLSRVTVGALEDLGYVVDYDAADDWSIPLLPTLSQVSPNPTDYRIELDFTSAYELSRLGQAEGRVVPIDLALGPNNASTSGCEATDFAGIDLTGAIALVQRGTCAFGDKAANALAAGAVGVLVGNQGNTADRTAPQTGTLGTYVDIVAVPVSYALMADLAAQAAGGEVIVRIDTNPSGDDLGPQSLPTIDWHRAEELVPLRGSIDVDGGISPLGD